MNASFQESVPSFEGKHDTGFSFTSDFNTGNPNSPRLSYKRLPSAHGLLQASSHDAKGVADGQLHCVMASSRAWIVIDVDIGAAFHRKVDTDPARVTGEMFCAWLSNDDI